MQQSQTEPRRQVDTSQTSRPQDHHIRVSHHRALSQSIYAVKLIALEHIFMYAVKLITIEHSFYVYSQIDCYGTQFLYTQSN